MYIVYILIMFKLNSKLTDLRIYIKSVPLKMFLLKFFSHSLKNAIENQKLQ